MRIDKTIKGEKIPYYVRLISNTMTAEVRYFNDDEPIIGTISEDFKYIMLPDTFLSPWISGHGNVKVGKLKLDKRMSKEAEDYNENKKL
jgi:hypothetical protein